MQSLPSVPPLSSRPLTVPIEAESSSPPDGRDLRPCPLPGHLVAIQMDPVGMVRALDLDEEAVKAAEVLATASQKYLVVISLGLDAIFTDSKWGRYAVYPVAGTSRVACPTLGITPDMVIPISLHPAPLTPTTTVDDVDNGKAEDLPRRSQFGNWSIWAFSSTLLRIHLRRGHDSFDIANAVGVPMSFEKDLRDLENTLAASLQSSTPPPPALLSSPSYYPPTPLDPALYADASVWESPARSTTASLETNGTGSANDESGTDSASNSGSDSADLFDDLMGLNFWGLNDRDPVTGYIPLFDAWLASPQHLDISDVGDPAMLWREQHLISLVIGRGLSRKRSAQTNASSSEIVALD